MTASRREKIEAMLKEDPHDSFLRYSLALELEKEGRNAESLDYLHGVIADDPSYVPAYFMAGQQLVRLGRLDEARSALRSGIDAARAQGNSHAAGEMSEFLTSIGSRAE